MSWSIPLPTQTDEGLVLGAWTKLLNVYLAQESIELTVISDLQEQEVIEQSLRIPIRDEQSCRAHAEGINLLLQATAMQAGPYEAAGAQAFSSPIEQEIHKPWVIRSAASSSKAYMDKLLASRGAIWELRTGSPSWIRFTTMAADCSFARSFLANLEETIRNFACQPDNRLDQVNLISETDAKALFKNAGADENYPEPERTVIHERVQRMAEQFPQQTAITDGPKKLTYSELNLQADRIAGKLKERGVQQGDCVGILLEKSIEAIVCMLGILKSGGAYVPIDPSYPDQRLKYIVKDCRPKLLILETERPEFEDHHTILYTELNTELNRPTDESGAGVYSTAAVEPEDLCYIIYTSGSTGTPKGVPINHRGVIHLFGSEFVEITACDRVLHASSLAFDASVFEIWGSLMHGAELVIVRREMMLDIDAFAAFIQRHRITAALFMPVFFNQLADHSPATLSSIRQIVVGGDALSQTHIKKALEWPGIHQIINAYGPTENTVVSTSYTMTPASREKIGRSIPIGRPLRGNYVLIVDENLGLLPTGAVGEICVAGPGVSQGYLNLPEKTAMSFVLNPYPEIPWDRLYRTGDLGRWDADGNIEFCGRKDHQVKIRGYRIELSEIELALQSMPDVKECAVLVEEAFSQKRLVAFVAASSPETPASFRERLKSLIPDYMVPSEIFVREELPLNANGKVDRSALRSQIRHMEQEVQGLEQPKEMDEAILQIWKNVIGKSDIGMDDHFFSIGGDSILMMSVLAKINETLHVQLTATALLKYPSVNKLVAYIKGNTFAKQELNMRLSRRKTFLSDLMLDKAGTQHE